ncbi:unnamed protein product, partial [Ectocarpus sp. 12 AP-2014]
SSTRSPTARSQPRAALTKSSSTSPASTLLRVPDRPVNSAAVRLVTLTAILVTASYVGDVFSLYSVASSSLSKRKGKIFTNKSMSCFYLRITFSPSAVLTFVLVGVHLLPITFLLNIMASPASTDNAAEDVDDDGDVNISDCPAMRLPFNPSGQSVPPARRGRRNWLSLFDESAVDATARSGDDDDGTESSLSGSFIDNRSVSELTVYSYQGSSSSGADGASVDTADVQHSAGNNSSVAPSDSDVHQQGSPASSSGRSSSSVHTVVVGSSSRARPIATSGAAGGVMPPPAPSSSSSSRAAQPQRAAEQTNRRTRGTEVMDIEYMRCRNGTINHAIFNDDAGIRYKISCTVTNKTGFTDITPEIFPKCCDFLHLACNTGAFGLEHGGTRRSLHAQGWFEVGVVFAGDPA